ncbi:glycoside hydrolase family 10 protein [Mucilaginibacter sp.]|uniref:glycoside hydrolase family 10 protein n=1 Tax=Mucilaginibacter sp. TaxID=1882438 RepID=UPI000CCB08F1|nr:family 10 glycosylhydrolase [Mucilaginibacter sp.]PLW91293.1 MAG: glycoside hydrolase [Mucilaginibacter sp.]HEK21932.1 glycoside hydrolase [Bacteroidota bacterium]
MHLYKYILSAFLCAFLYSSLSAHPTAARDTSTQILLDTIKQPKREFRGVWIATVVNLDWPTNARAGAEAQKRELASEMNTLQQTGINAIMFQVRPAADAFYAHSREPWSKYLTGRQGQSPGYDPLDFAVTESHKRGMELHAWFNPYRATFDGRFAMLAPEHITRVKPEWFFIYDGIKLFNPGIPEVREYIVQVVLDVVKNYDVDGIHMDDYFYPYPVRGQVINDVATFAQYGEGFDNIRDWRRNNVDQLIHMLADSIHKYKPHMKFGISPFGIWANKSQHPDGSATSGGSSYIENFADTRKWMQEGWIDYINPQIYWQIGNRSAAFDVLLNWWSNNTFNRHLYVGQAPYRFYEARSPAFKNPSEIPNQLRMIRANPRAQGSVYFRAQSIIGNANHIADSLRQDFYRHPALPPEMLWLDSVPPNPVQNFTARPENKGIMLKWAAPLPASDNEPVYGYVIYRFQGNEKFDLADPKNILHIQYDTEAAYFDTNVRPGATYFYVVTALDRLKNESERSPTVAVTVP